MDENGHEDVNLSDQDPELAAAMQESIEVEEEAALRRALEASRMSIANPHPRSVDATSTADSVELPEEASLQLSSDVDEDMYVPGRLETALAIAGAGPTPQRLSSMSTPRRPSASNNTVPKTSMFGKPTLLLSKQNETPTKAMGSPAGPSRTPTARTLSRAATIAEPVSSAMEYSDDDLYMEEVPVPVSAPKAREPSVLPKVPDSVRSARSPLPSPPPIVIDDSDADMEEIIHAPSSAQAVGPIRSPLKATTNGHIPHPPKASTSTPARLRFASPPVPSVIEADPLPQEDEEDLYGGGSPSAPSTPLRSASAARSGMSEQVDTTSTPPPSTSIESKSKPAEESDDSDEALTDWSRSPSPVPRQTSHMNAENDTNEPGPSNTSRAKEDNWDAAQEMDAHAEEGEFARFISQVKGKDLDSVRMEIDEEIKSLNEQRKAAMRDSEDVTQQMVSQIMVSFPPLSRFRLDSVVTE